MVFRSLKANQHGCRLTLARLLRGGLLDGLSLLPTRSPSAPASTHSGTEAATCRSSSWVLDLQQRRPCPWLRHSRFLTVLARPIRRVLATNPRHVRRHGCDAAGG